MKVVCISTCQHKMKELFIKGQEYDIDKCLYNKDFFKKITKKKPKNN